MALYHWLRHKKDSNNKIVKCILKDLRTGNIIEEDRDKLKALMDQYKLEHNEDLVDNLFLTKDNKLMVSRDNIIDKYIESCRLLGIAPLEIKRLENDYVITNIPRDIRNIQIPKFVTGIKLEKRLGTSDRDTNSLNWNKISEDDLDIKNDIDELKKAMLYELKMQKDDLKYTNEHKGMLDEIIRGLHNIENKQELTDIQLQNHVSSINQAISDISAELPNNVAIVGSLNEIKQFLEQDSQQMYQIANNLEPTLRRLISDANSLGSGNITKLSDISKFPQKLGFITSMDDYAFSSEDKYKGIYASSGSVNLIPFNVIKSMEGLVECILEIMEHMRLSLNEMDETQANKLSMFAKFSKKLSMISKTSKESTDLMKTLQTNSTANNLDAIAKATPITSAIKGAVDLTSDGIFAWKKAYNTQEGILKLLSEPCQLLNEFCGKSDIDVLQFLLERRLGFIAKRKDKLKKELYDRKVTLYRNYKELNDYLDRSAQDTSKNGAGTSLRDKTIDRIATAYIVSRKIVEGKIFDLDLIPNLSYDSSAQLLETHPYYIGKEGERKYRSFYIGVLLSFMEPILLLEGFTPKFAHNNIIEPLKGYYNVKICNILKEEKDSLSFDIRNHVNFLQDV